jgi:hypothetical protein
MAKATGKVATALAVSAALLTARAATAADARDRPTIVLHVDDFGHFLASDMDAAEKVAARIFGSAGIQTVWRRGRKPLPRIEGAMYLKVLVLSLAMAVQKISSDDVGDGVLGRAAKASGRAYIFSHRVAALAARNQRSVGDVLGWVIAHEVGHLVLPENSHSPTGIMSAAIDLRPTATPAFTPEQTAAIRVALRSAN